MVFVLGGVEVVLVVCDVLIGYFEVCVFVFEILVEMLGVLLIIELLIIEVDVDKFLVCMI